ncbi:MAG: sugar phosphate isomerase/epimerase, partial [Lachnospiraceae bacterium]|nr:sugar phosphate isomerase/epimerase [Lachnospiraceae bacterium]
RGFHGVEIAPTRIFPEHPYDCLKEAKAWSRNLYEVYGLTIPSMQSIWYGRTEKLFGTETERQMLMDYTKRAIDFAAAIQCKNLVFGSPKNRVILPGMEAEQVKEIEMAFFGELGDYAAQNDTVLSMEANPPIYQTNYINGTKDAICLVEKIDSAGFRVNLDVGTMIANGESAEVVTGAVTNTHHVHISEPGLALIQERSLHRELLPGLWKNAYTGFVSVEMGRREDLTEILSVLDYVKDIAEEEKR